LARCASLGPRIGYARLFDWNMPMPRPTLEEARLHPSIRDKVANLNADIVHNVQAATASNPVLVVGMAGNPFCKRARKALAAAGVAHHYLEYGSYFSQWRDRNALKMWSGWPTFPMVFVKGSLIGGADDLKRLIDSGELKRLLGE
jgi:glutaredoxin-related protein